MKSYLLILCFILSSLLVSAQTQFDSVRVYNDFDQRGYTTAGAYSHFDDLNDSGTAMIALNKDDLKDLELLLSKAKEKKHWQTKFGKNNIFLIGYENGKINRLVIASEVSVINLTTRKEYRLTEQEVTQLKLLIGKIKSMATTTE